jgi:hypothetical protein
LCIQKTQAVDGLIGDIVDFAPSSNWYNWIVRVPSANSGRGQIFLTPTGTTQISSIALKVCRQSNFTRPKILTLCPSSMNGSFAGCTSPLVIKTFTPEELNELVPFSSNCLALNEGGQADGQYFKWTVFSFDTPTPVSGNTSYFFLMNSATSADNEPANVMLSMYNNCNYLGTSADYPNGQTYYYRGSARLSESSALCDQFFKVFSSNPITIPFEITSHSVNNSAVRDTWVTVTGTCPLNGQNRIGFTNNCLGFEDIEYNVSCVDNEFSGQFYYNGQGDKRLIVRDIDSMSGDCVDYDDLMDYKTLQTVEIINGYPDDWYFNFDYYDDYDIRIKSPSFDTALTLPIESTSANFTFGFIYPPSSTLSNLVFNIKQYTSSGVLLNGSYHTRTLSTISNTWNYTVNLTASSTVPLHYVVQLIDSGQMRRQYPFAIYVSDLGFSANIDATTYFFPRLVEALKRKIVFNYFFTFHDNFADMFNVDGASVSSTALDITLKSMSADKQYNMDIKVFSASDSSVRNFANGLRPFITAFLWLAFALYVVFRVARLFSSNDE